MSMDKRWSELFARLEAIEQQVESLNKALGTDDATIRKAAEKHQQPVKKATVKK